MFKMTSPSSPPLGYVLKDHNHPDHTSRDSNSHCPPTHSSKSDSRSPSKPRKINLKEPANENHLVDERKSSARASNQCRSCSSFHKNQEDVPPPSPLMSRRQARVLDQWAAQQARETITTIERRKHSEFDISSISDSNYVSFRSRPTSRETSPSPSDSSVSSLVQKWREFEISDIKQPPNHPTPSYQNHNEGGNSGACSILVSRANSTTSSVEPSEQENNSINNWEPESVINNDNNSFDTGGSKNVAKEKIRVVDIIKKLPLVECDKASTVYSPVVLSSPRIRGRQAMAELFAKQERDRYSEIEATSKRQAVSKFPKRGPLQTMLKLRALRHEVSSQDKLQQQSPRVCELNKLKMKSCSSSSSINNIRERFNPTLSECDDSVKTIQIAQDCQSMTTNSIMEEASASSQPSQTTKAINTKSNQEETTSLQFDKRDSNHAEIDQVEVNNILNGSLRGKTHEKEQEEGNKEKMNNMSRCEEVVPQLTNLQEEKEEEHVRPEMILSSNAIWPKTRKCDESINCIPLETKNVSSYAAWENRRICDEEEQEGVYDDYDLCGPYLDWINDVSRPRSYWESLRQAWYNEIFTSSSKNEIRQLIERGNVSNVLASDFPEKMDRIMMSSSMRRQTKPRGYDDDDERQLSVAFTCNQLQPLNIHLEEEKNDHQDLHKQDFIVEEPIINVHQRIEEPKQEITSEKDVGGNEEDVEEEPESSSSNQYNNRAFYKEQAQTSSSLLPWTNYDNQEDSDNSEQFEPAPHQEQSSITNSFDQDTQGGSSSCKNNSSIEMELIYDFRAHMEQMYREISELRMSVNNCVNMQAKLQSSIKDEVSAALSHSSLNKTKGKESNGKVPKKGSCCICYEKKVDSVLYRCGHMCACFKCAHELQWSSGKCPICRAQIADVVRVYTEDA